jgi:diguanylate cyclase (GGDEF)-like protein/PAS domain S-box-containing protein
MAFSNQVPDLPDATASKPGDPVGKLSGRLIARRRFVLPATWLLSVLVAIALAAHGAGTSAPWNPVQLLELLLLFSATWTVAWLMSATPAGSPAGSPLGLDTGDGATAEWLALVARRTGYSVTINDPERRLVWVNESFTRLTGYTAEEAIGRNTSDLLYFERTDSGTVARIRESFAARRGIRFEILVRGKDGREWWLDTDARPLLGARGELNGWICIQADITEQVHIREELRRSEREISFLAYHDPLTGLANRLGFRGRLDKVLARAIETNRRCAVMLIDLDRFKHVNDTLGHDIGDKLLAEVARRVRASVREVDIVARLGGDEFVVVIPDLNEDMSLETIVAKLFDQLHGNIDLPGRVIYTSASVGVAVSPKDGTDGSTLLQHADLAMYAAKYQGGDSYRLFDSSMASSVDRLALEVDLRGAVERQEMVLHYQPRVDTITGRPVGFEALIRWNHPTRGLIAPGVFIPIAEETGLIDSIGQWVLETACADLRKWLDAGGEPLRLSVNLSPLQLARETLPERIAAVLAAAGIPAQLLELEITESAAMRSPEVAERHLARLKALGITLSIDDFGTGHSSLARLKLLNVDCLKIDGSLVKDCAVDAYDAALCRATIALGRALGLVVVAEGVEMQEQWQFLAQEQCNAIQGHLIARPMPAIEAFAFLRNALEMPRLRVTGTNRKL